MGRADNLHSEGYHGTSLSIGLDIKSHGFARTNRTLFFAPLNHLVTAQRYGVIAAHDRGDEMYGVVHAEFLEIEEQVSSFSTPEIEIPSELIVGVRVLDLLVFDLQQNRLFIPG